MSVDAPKYLGIKLDELKTRNNIISKLVGTSWGCRANVFRISALALVYSVVECCAPV
jgi:hypothetical protein